MYTIVIVLCLKLRVDGNAHRLPAKVKVGKKLKFGLIFQLFHVAKLYTSKEITCNNGSNNG